ncbi:MAG: restriction endonuclease subunit S [Bifidobacterium pseudocatenulatum]|uniref:restriction endonuclease subunit S n=1 Tax=Bifidobacterium pseudocatenulatum TaxID=28026 RepID=UPI0022E13767|nr:restriction endonuclease subunit S [Bifidobacterium pseudocatenulatum]MDU3991622.1 restriction endonuclease subunit S [Bifidobacterium pseudocatenulatum]
MVEQHEKTLVPQIRFAGFTDPWEQRKLGEVANVCSGRDYKHLAEGPIPVYGTGGYMTSVSKALSYDEDAIGIGRKGTIDKPYRLQAPFWTVDTLFYAIPEASSDINFLLCSFLNVDWKSKDESTGLPSLSKRAINETEVLVPDNGEQRRIGAFFDRLDSLITLHQRKYDKLCVLKKSMLDKMFPKGGSLYPEIRFAGFTDPWEQRKVGEVAYGFEYGLNAAASDFDGEKKYLRITDIDDQTREFRTDDLSSPDINNPIDDKYLLKEGDILFARTGASVGKTYLYKASDGKTYYAGFLIRAHVSDEADAGFIFQSTLTERYKQFVLLTSQRSGQPGINAQEYADLLLPLPSLSEQRRIGAFFDRLDSLITLHQRKLELLRNIKKSMLDKMFV